MNGLDNRIYYSLYILLFQNDISRKKVDLDHFTSEPSNYSPRSVNNDVCIPLAQCNIEFRNIGPEVLSHFLWRCQIRPD